VSPDPKTAEWQEGYEAGRKAGAAELSQRVDVLLTRYYAGEPNEPRRVVRECMKTLGAILKQELAEGFGDRVK
jgi:hypothetical protein